MLAALSVSLAVLSVFLLGFLKVFFPFCPYLLWIFSLEALESNFAGLIGAFLLCLQISDLRWFPEVGSRRRSFTHSDAFSKMEVYRAVTPVFVPTPLSGSMVISGDFGFVCCFAAMRILVDLCWRLEICVRFCLGWLILGFFFGDLLVMGRILVIGASFPCCGNDEICGGGLVAAALLQSCCFVDYRVCSDLGFLLDNWYRVFCWVMYWSPIFGF